MHFFRLAGSNPPELQAKGAEMRNHHSPQSKSSRNRLYLQETQRVRLGIGRYGSRAAELARDLNRKSVIEQITRLERRLVRAVTDLELEVRNAR